MIVLLNDCFYLKTINRYHVDFLIPKCQATLLVSIENWRSDSKYQKYVAF